MLPHIIFSFYVCEYFQTILYYSFFIWLVLWIYFIKVCISIIVSNCKCSRKTVCTSTIFSTYIIQVMCIFFLFNLFDHFIYLHVYFYDIHAPFSSISGLLSMCLFKISYLAQHKTPSQGSLHSKRYWMYFIVFLKILYNQLHLFFYNLIIFCKSHMIDISMSSLMIPYNS